MGRKVCVLVDGLANVLSSSTPQVSHELRNFLLFLAFCDISHRPGRIASFPWFFDCPSQAPRSGTSLGGGTKSKHHFKDRFDTCVGRHILTPPLCPMENPTVYTGLKDPCKGAFGESA
jgi:hypothetical protein